MVIKYARAKMSFVWDSDEIKSGKKGEIKALIKLMVAMRAKQTYGRKTNISAEVETTA